MILYGFHITLFYMILHDSKLFYLFFIITMMKLIIIIIIMLEVGPHFSNVPFVLNINVSRILNVQPNFERSAWNSNV